MSKRGDHGHHGGAWKVAYADFVTSMMALFLVLWLVSSDQETREAVQAYFRGEKVGAAMKRPGAVHESDTKPFKPKPDDRASRDLVALEKFNRDMERLRDQLNNSSEAGEDLIRFEFLADGVRIVAIDRSKKPFFSPGTADFTDFGQFVMNTIAWEVERHPYMVEVEGHTQKGSDSSGDQKVAEGDQAWDLSTRRAMAARKALQGGGVDETQFWRVAGYADREPLDKGNPTAEENRRISVVIRPKLDDNIDQLKETFRNSNNNNP
jgi:chemotaxis protein MotB